MTLTRFLMALALLSVLSGLLSAGLTSTPAPEKVEEGESDWRVIPLLPAKPKKDLSERLQRLSLWSGEVSGAALGVLDEPLKADADGVIRIDVEWQFKGVVAKQGVHYALVRKSDEDPFVAYYVGDILPSGERVELLRLDKLLFSLPSKVDEVDDTEAGGDTGGMSGETVRFSRQLYAPKDKAASVPEN